MLYVDSEELLFIELLPAPDLVLRAPHSASLSHLHNNPEGVSHGICLYLVYSYIRKVAQEKIKCLVVAVPLHKTQEDFTEGKDAVGMSREQRPQCRHLH